MDQGELLAALEAENARLRLALAEAEAGRVLPPANPFHVIADSIDQLIWTTRADGYHDYFNRRWYEFTGMPEGTTDGEEWNGMFHPDDQDRAWEVWRRSLATGDPYHIEYRLRHRSGQYRWVLGVRRQSAGRTAKSSAGTAPAPTFRISSLHATRWRKAGAAFRLHGEYPGRAFHQG
jgi:PAS domain S-box-containing protein